MSVEGACTWTPEDVDGEFVAVVVAAIASVVDVELCPS